MLNVLVIFKMFVNKTFSHINSIFSNNQSNKNQGHIPQIHLNYFSILHCKFHPNCPFSPNFCCPLWTFAQNYGGESHLYTFWKLQKWTHCEGNWQFRGIFFFRLIHINFKLYFAICQNALICVFKMEVKTRVRSICETGPKDPFY